jgi:integrase
VLTREEVRRVLARLNGTHLLMAQLLYGSGLRLVENPFASRHASKRVSPSLARAAGAVGLMQC